MLSRLRVASTLPIGNRPTKFPAGLDTEPPPVAELTSALVWHWPDVERWARATGRLS